MNAESILSRIDQDAREAAARILRDAQAKAEESRKASEAHIEQAREAAMEQARKDAIALDDRMQRMAKLDARKALLAAKREVLDEAFSQALDTMAAMPDDQARAFGLSMLLSSAVGDETVYADAASAWCDQGFVTAANAALVQSGRQGALRLSGEKRNLGGGFVLARGGLEVNCSYKAALDAGRMDLEAEVAALLFES